MTLSILLTSMLHAISCSYGWNGAQCLFYPLDTTHKAVDPLWSISHRMHNAMILLLYLAIFFAYTMVNCSIICIVRCIYTWLTIVVPFIDIHSSTFIHCTNDFASRLCFTTAMDPSSFLSLMIPLNLTMIFNIYMSLLCQV